MLLWPADLQLQVVFFGGKLVREGVSLAIVKQQILGCDVRRTELHQRHDVLGLLLCLWPQITTAKKRLANPAQSPASTALLCLFCFFPLFSTAICERR